MNSHFYPQYVFGVLNSSSTLAPFWVLDMYVPTTDLLLRKYTQHTKVFHRMACMIWRRASHFELQLRDRVAWDAAYYCRILCKEHVVLRTREQEDNM